MITLLQLYFKFALYPSCMADVDTVVEDVYLSMTCVCVCACALVGLLYIVNHMLSTGDCLSCNEE